MSGFLTLMEDADFMARFIDIAEIRIDDDSAHVHRLFGEVCRAMKDDPALQSMYGDPEMEPSGMCFRIPLKCDHPAKHRVNAISVSRPWTQTRFSQMFLSPNGKLMGDPYEFDTVGDLLEILCDPVCDDAEY